MGLQEKRARKAAEDGWIPKRLAELAGICGDEIPCEVDWDSFDGDAKGLEWLEFNGPHQVNAAMRGICTDPLGKEAVVDAVKKVVYRNVGAIDAKAVELADGALTVTCAYAHSPRGRFNDREIRQVIEGAL